MFIGGFGKLLINTRNVLLILIVKGFFLLSFSNRRDSDFLEGLSFVRLMGELGVIV